MQPDVQAVYRACEAAHMSIYKAMAAVKQRLPGETSMLEAADAGYALRKAKQYIEDIRSVLTQYEELAIKIACAAWVIQEGQEPIRTHYCTGSPDVKRMVSIPNPKDPNYASFMTALGVPEHLWASDCVRPHWPGMIEYVNRKLQSGEPLPVGTDAAATYAVFKMTFRGRKEVTDSL